MSENPPLKLSEASKESNSFDHVNIMRFKLPSDACPPFAAAGDHWAAYLVGIPLGCASVYRIPGAHKDRKFVLHWIEVKEETRRKGIGMMLLDAIDLYYGDRLRVLFTNDGGNDLAIAFVAKHGARDNWTCCDDDGEHYPIFEWCAKRNRLLSGEKA